MIVDYNNFAEKFAEGRKGMKWNELDYFFSLLSGDDEILDIGCGSGRFLEQYKIYFGKFPKKYIGVDLSEKLILEAKKDFPEQKFIVGNMLDIVSLLPQEQYKNIFLIASFHHLGTFQERKDFLGLLYHFIEQTGKIFLTNWNLLGENNLKKYAQSEIIGSENIFQSKDFSIKFGKSQRFYHSFSLQELEHLALETNFTIVENRVFHGEKNIITILQK